MSRDLPPFAGVRAFEAGARHLSFRRAAEELCVTPSAISHQIKRLERHLGLPLFERRARGLDLTPEGWRYMHELGEILDHLATATARFKMRSGPATITVSLVHTLATRWLIPRLTEFQAAHPNIDIRLSASATRVDLRHSDIDLAIRYGRNASPGLHCEQLIAENVFPVCAPSLIAEGEHLTTYTDLSGYRFIYNQSHPQEWPQWFRAVGAIHDIRLPHGPSFATSDLALRAAVAGMGVALGRRPLVDEELDSGRLVAPLDLQVDSGYRYFLVSLPDKAELPNIKLFRDWLAATARDYDTDTE